MPILRVIKRIKLKEARISSKLIGIIFPSIPVYCYACLYYLKLSHNIYCFCMQSVRDILLLGHRQAFAWIDEWIGQWHVYSYLSNL